MRPTSSRLAAAALVVCLLAATEARAEFVSWRYNWTPAAAEILADLPPAGKILLSNEPGGRVIGNSYIVATNLKTASTAAPSAPTTFTDKKYALTLAIQDEATNRVGTLNFTGVFNGSLSSKSSTLSNTFTGPQTQSVQVGNHLYTVQIGPFASPGPPTANNFGGISAFVSTSFRDMGVPNAPPISNLPEPSALVLCGLCLILCSVGWCWKRIRAPLRLDVARRSIHHSASAI